MLSETESFPFIKKKAGKVIKCIPDWFPSVAASSLCMTCPLSAVYRKNLWLVSVSPFLSFLRSWRHSSVQVTVCFILSSTSKTSKSASLPVNFPLGLVETSVEMKGMFTGQKHQTIYVTQEPGPVWGCKRRGIQEPTICSHGTSGFMSLVWMHTLKSCIVILEKMKMKM